AGVFLLFATVLLPRYLTFFVESGIPLPPLLRTIQIVVSNLGSIAGAGLAGISVVGGWIIYQKLRRFFLSWFQVGYSDLFWLLSAYLESGVPLIRIVEQIQPSDPDIVKRWGYFRARLIQTARFSDSLAAFFPLSSFHRELLLLGETSGKLGEVIGRVGHELRTEEQLILNRKIKRIQPICLVIIASITTVSLLAVLYPTIALINTIH
ncbi:hypothetical protein EBR96_08775, partial [bacterium]|nr:hypothetical protein [bacterium]